MGFTTFVHILNDGMDQLKKHPEEFVEAVFHNHYSGGNTGVGCHINMLDILPSQHADTFQLVASHGNLPVVLSKYDKRTLELISDRPDIVENYIRAARRELDLLEEALDE